MLGWGPAFVAVSFQRLGAAELAQVGLRDPALRRCVIRFGFEYRRDAHAGCRGGAVVRRRPGWCVELSATFFCAINPLGAYVCPLRHEPDRTRPLRHPNGKTDERGALTLDVPLTGTHATPQLAWQRRYPHVDGWIEPWTTSGTLRPGLRFAAAFRGGGSCFFGSQEIPGKRAVRCVWRATLAGVDPCFPQHLEWHHRGALVACPTSPGGTSFARFVIS
jgi:hypothetical protein